MELSINFKANRARTSRFNLARSVFGDGLTLDVAQIDQVFVHVDLTILLLVAQLNPSEKIMRAFLHRNCESIRQVYVHLVAHSFRKHC